MATAAGANITTSAGFPEHIFLENLAIRRRVDPGQRPQARAAPRRPAAGRFGLGANLRYGFARFSGAALAPWVAGVLGERTGVHAPFWVGAVTVVVGAGVLAASRRHLAGVDVEEDELDEITDQATAVTIGSES
jgi:hypothetical protein